MVFRDETMTDDRGRLIAYTEIGAPDGNAVVFFHGAPASRLDLAHLEAECSQRGHRLITVDRPGYGLTSPLPGRSLDGAVVDTIAVLDALGVETFIAVGHSSGGPYALATAAAVTDRCSGTAVLAGVTDMHWPGAWFGYIPMEIPFMRADSEDQAIALAAATFGTDGAGFLDGGGIELPIPDLEWLIDPANSAGMLESVSEAFRQGVIGYAQDLYVQGQPWPFAPGSLRGPVLVVHGEHDTLVPLAHSRHTAELVPSATLRVVGGHGHLTVLSELPDVVDELAATSHV